MPYLFSQFSFGSGLLVLCQQLGVLLTRVSLPTQAAWPSPLARAVPNSACSPPGPLLLDLLEASLFHWGKILTLALYWGQQLRDQHSHCPRKLHLASVRTPSPWETAMSPPGDTLASETWEAKVPHQKGQTWDWFCGFISNLSFKSSASYSVRHGNQHSLWWRAFLGHWNPETA